MIHLKRSNSYYGYRGIQPQYIGACQTINKEVVPEKMKLATKAVFIGAYKENPGNCCPDCARIAEVLPVQRLTDQQFYEMLLVNDSGLEYKLYKHTEELYTTFMNEASVKAGAIYSRFEELHAMTYEQWVAKYPQKYISRYDGAESTILSKDGSRLRYNAARAIRMGRTAFVTKSEDNARQHYIDSTIKLADRLRRKGVTDSVVMHITSERIDIAGNIAINIYFDDQTVKASTIWAHGPIQSPHFRYLVK